MYQCKLWRPKQKFESTKGESCISDLEYRLETNAFFANVALGGIFDLFGAVVDVADGFNIRSREANLVAPDPQVAILAVDQCQ